MNIKETIKFQEDGKIAIILLLAVKTVLKKRRERNKGKKKNKRD